MNITVCTIVAVGYYVSVVATLNLQFIKNMHFVLNTFTSMTFRIHINYGLKCNRNISPVPDILSSPNNPMGMLLAFVTRL
jgi:hypothetical protein